MKIFITGATGFIGMRLAEELAEAGHEVHALFRSKQKAEKLNHERIHEFQGDLLDVDSLRRAMEGCEQVYHVAAYAKAWARNPQLFFDVNVQGTVNMLEVMQEVGAKRMVFTSTAGVMGPSIDGTVTEQTRFQDFFNEYDRSKAEAEAKVAEYVQQGLEVITVNPTRVYGPGLLSQSNSATRLMHLYEQGKWRIVPGDGERIGNYVFVEDVVQGHLLAMQHGTAGERYLLGGSNVSYNELFGILRKQTEQTQLLVNLPVFVMMAFAHLQTFIADNFKREPMITPPLIRKYLYDWDVSSQKAVRDLGYRFTPIEEGVEQTLKWIRTNL